MELPIPAIVDQLDVPTMFAVLLIFGYKVLRRLDRMIDGLGSVRQEQRRVSEALDQHRDEDREDFRVVHQRLDGVIGQRPH